MIGLLFLVKDSIPHLKKWMDWMRTSPNRVGIAAIHPWAGHFESPDMLDDLVIPTVPTSWEQTLPALRALAFAGERVWFMNEAGGRERPTHLMYVSESCVPIQGTSPDDLVAIAQRHPDKTILSRMGGTNKARIITGRTVDWTVFPHEWRNHRLGVQHEQWVMLNRNHIAAYKDDAVAAAFSRCFADNEHYPYYAVRHMFGESALAFENITYTDWRLGGPHPKTFKRGLPDDVAKQARAKGFVLARKVTR